MTSIVERTWHGVPFHGHWDGEAIIVFVSAILSTAQEGLAALHLPRSLSLPLLDHAESPLQYDAAAKAADGMVGCI